MISVFADSDLPSYAPQGPDLPALLEAMRRRMAASRKKASLKKAAGEAKARKKPRLPPSPKDRPKKLKLRKKRKEAPVEKKEKVSKHNPFRHKDPLGPTTIHLYKPPAPPPEGTRQHARKKCWKCHKTSAYKQMCISTGNKGCPKKGTPLEINIDRKYKRGYNHSFKLHRTRERARARG